MICVLTSNSNFADEYAFSKLKDIIKPNMKVICFTYASNLIWQSQNQDRILYGDERRKLYEPFRHYGIQEDNFITAPFPNSKKNVDYIKEKIKISEVIVFNGGCMENLMLLLQLSGLKDFILEHKEDKIFIGSSAGAMILQDRYHISPNVDDLYNYYGAKNGLGLVEGISIQPHFHKNNIHHGDNLAFWDSCLKNRQVLGLGESGGVVVEIVKGSKNKRYCCTFGETYKIF